MKGIIIGGGIAGLTAAIALQKAGHEIEVYESAPEFKPIGAGIVLAGNAINAFKALGIAENVMEQGQLIPQLLLKEHRGKIISFIDSRQLKNKYDVDNFAIHRAKLHSALFSLISPDIVFTGKKANSFTENGKSVTVNFLDGTTASGDYVIAADGIHSAIRKQLFPDVSPRYAGYTCWRSVTPQLSSPVLSPSETWGKGRRFGIVPLANDKIYWFATLNSRQADLQAKNFRVQDLKKVFRDFHDPVQEILSITHNDQIIWADIMDVPPQKKFFSNRILLIGDAAHATTPNMGQGACMAIEDAAALYFLVKKYQDDITSIFRGFEKGRIKRTNKIVKTSWQIGRMAQWENPLAIGIRNKLMKMVPNSVRLKQLRFLYEEDLQSVN